jgi:hypothetical protein
MLTRRQIYLACAGDPTYDNACTREEVRAWRCALAGTVVDEPDFGILNAFNCNGKRKWFYYCHKGAEAVDCCPGDYEMVREDAAYWALSSTANYQN